MRRGPYERVLSWPVLRTVLAVIVVVQAVSFAEAFTGNLETVLRYGARISDFLWLQLYEMPDTLPLALPVALCLAVYLAVTSARDQGALVALSAAGIAPTRIVGFALCVGALGAALILSVTAELLPRAKLAERALFHEMQTYARVQALDSASFGLVTQDVPGLTLIFGARDGLAISGEDDVVIINHAAQGWRFAHAATAEVVRAPGTAVPSLRLEAARAFGLPGDGQYGLFDADEITLGFSSADYLPPFDARLRADEVPRLTCLTSAAHPCPPDGLGDLWRLAALAMVASFFALLGAAFDRVLYIRGSGLVIALAGTVGADILTRAAREAALGGASIALLLGLALVLILRSMPRLLRPTARA